MRSNIVNTLRRLVIPWGAKSTDPRVVVATDDPIAKSLGRSAAVVWYMNATNAFMVDSAGGAGGTFAIEQARLAGDGTGQLLGTPFRVTVDALGGSTIDIGLGNGANGVTVWPPLSVPTLIGPGDVRLYGALGDGSTDDTAAIQSALNAAYNGGGPWGKVVTLPAGFTFRISAPLVIPPYVTLRGGYQVRGSNTQATCLKSTAGFTGSAMLLMVDQATGGYAVPSYGQVIENVTLDGGAAKAFATFSGIRANGSVKGVTLRNVAVVDVSDRGVQSATVSSANPYSWQIENVQVSAPGVDGFRLSGMTDTTMVGCRVIGAGRYGYNLDGMANSSFTACRAEWSGQRGWFIASNWGSGNGSGGATWVGCSTDRNDQDGFWVEATGTATLTFSGCVARRDGRNAGAGFGGYSGFAVVGATTPVVVDGLAVFPGVDDGGGGHNSPQNGVRVATSTWFGLGSGYVHADGTAILDGGGNGALLIGTAVGRATGTTAAPVRV